MDPKCTNDTMFWYYIDLDENLAWLTQKTKEWKCIKETLLFPHTYSRCNGTVK